MPLERMPKINKRGGSGAGGPKILHTLCGPETPALVETRERMKTQGHTKLPTSVRNSMSHRVMNRRSIQQSTTQPEAAKCWHLLKLDPRHTLRKWKEPDTGVHNPPVTFMKMPNLDKSSQTVEERGPRHAGCKGRLLNHASTPREWWGDSRPVLTHNLWTH